MTIGGAALPMAVAAVTGTATPMLGGGVLAVAVAAGAETPIPALADIPESCRLGRLLS
jgi:hypothetical protein